MTVIYQIPFLLILVLKRGGCIEEKSHDLTQTDTMVQHGGHACVGLEVSLRAQVDPEWSLY